MDTVQFFRNKRYASTPTGMYYTREYGQRLWKKQALARLYWRIAALSTRSLIWHRGRAQRPPVLRRHCQLVVTGRWLRSSSDWHVNRSILVRFSTDSAGDVLSGSTPVSNSSHTSLKTVDGGWHVGDLCTANQSSVVSIEMVSQPITANTYTSDFPDVKFRVAALIRYRRKQSGSGIRTMIRIGLKS